MEVVIVGGEVDSRALGFGKEALPDMQLPIRHQPEQQVIKKRFKMSLGREIS